MKISNLRHPVKIIDQDEHWIKFCVYFRDEDYNWLKYEVIIPKKDLKEVE
jgi:hypothetical protein